VNATGITWPAANVLPTRLDSLAADAINVAANGTVPAIEQARTALENGLRLPFMVAADLLTGGRRYAQVAVADESFVQHSCAGVVGEQRLGWGFTLTASPWTGDSTSE
jgi:hypothetical protein